MHRRTALAAFAALMIPPHAGSAQGGGTAPGADRPLYLEGEVSTLLWSDPQAGLELVPDPQAKVPPDLARRLVAREQDGPARAQVEALLARAVPAPPGSRVWQVQMPSLAQLSVLDVPRPEVKGRIAVVGHPGPAAQGTPTLRAEVLFIGGRGYLLRTGPR